GRHHTRGRLTQLLSTRGLVGKKACGSASNPFRSKRRGGYALDEKVCSFRRTHLRSDFVKRLTFNSGSFHCISDGEDPKSKEIFLAPFQYLFLVYFSVEKLMHQRPNPIHFFFQREMARVEKMELCTGNISFIEFSTLHRKDCIVFTPSDQRGGCCLRKYSCQSA